MLGEHLVGTGRTEGVERDEADAAVVRHVAVPAQADARLDDHALRARAGDHALAVAKRLLLEQLAAGHGDDAHGVFRLGEALRGLDADRHLAARGDEHDLRERTRLVDHVGALRHLLLRDALQHGHVLARREDAARAVLALEHLHPARAGLVRVGGTEREQVRRGAQGGDLLHGLVRGAVFPDVERVVREHPDGRQAHQRGEAHRGLAVVAEHGERGAEGAEPAVRRDAVHDRAHAELADAEVEVASREVAGRDPAVRLESGLVRRLEVRAAAHEERHLGRERVHHRAARRARGDGLRGIEHGELRGEVRRDRAARGRLAGRRLLRVRRLPGLEELLPAQVHAVARRAAVLERVEHGAGHLEELRGVEAERRLESGELLGAERRAVHGARVVLRGRAEADVRLRDREVGRALDRDVVGVVDEHELVELQLARERARLVGDALLEVAVAAEHPRAVVVDGQAVLVAVARGLHALGEREAHAHGDALAERARRDLHAGREAAFGMAGAAGAELAERLELVERELAHAGEVEERVDEGRAVPAGEHEPVAVRPLRVGGVVLEELQPERGDEVRDAERHAGVAALRLLHFVRREAADRVGGELDVFVRVFHFQRPFTSAAASAASWVMVSQSFDASASLGTIHVPPQATISGTAR